MQVQEMVIEDDSTALANAQYTPVTKLTRNDVHFPLTTPRRRAPSTALIADTMEADGKSMGRLTIRAGGQPFTESGDTPRNGFSQPDRVEETSTYNQTLSDLPLEVQGKVIDFIFGDMHSVSPNSHSLRGKNVSSLMRHPRRKAVSDFALVSAAWRDLVQERIYRHIKIKGTRAGLQECEDFFASNMHLSAHVRHIEVWVPVWGDKGSLVNDEPLAVLRNGGPRHLNYPLAHQPDDMSPAADPLGFTFKMAAQTATLSEIFSHISVFFDKAKVFTLEGGHCKKSNMIRHFPKVLFTDPKTQSLTRLPQIRTFAMRGSWNIMRSHADWLTIERALPNVEEWHCGYAKPRIEAELTINDILSTSPSRWRSVNVCLDGMYSKDTTTLGSSSGLVGAKQMHLCERLGDLLPQLESLSYTGKVCECLWKSALARLSKSKVECRLQSLEIVVKSCCRQRVTTVDTVTGEAVEEELGGVMADGAGISNLVFIKAFERLVLSTVEALRWAVNLRYVRIRYIDLDSECTHLNPYWILNGDHVWGIWSEEVVERLQECRPSAGYVELGDGIDIGGKVAQETEGDGRGGSTWINVPAAAHNTGAAYGAAANGPGFGGIGYAGAAHGNPERSVASLYPRLKPKSIKTSSYKILSEARGS
ncbi:uncharacterized protein HMPREF1541_06380 [Cyphellophora europaea CBS 101466]|uniref:Uncharacterized protein n=1 Tax=Cyphellophora europaea (strain CBS 101466) TaxID=1220924 RepID=W2RPW3_CYPE1|nr:uncharacterized protein HMPREF1541_06380 [Cyphellophora europaea CBS 101466]ETN38345.1 hypothetical protein HMPREF1541_06380 [Cyphellophora europaea CBS 101466]